jgi:hypothetical protein
MQDLASKRSRYRGPRSSDEASGLKLKAVLETGMFQRYCLRFGLPFQEADFHK